jgi:alkylation response protein AidB-like acyl-CoA dehydrogenase
MQRVRDRGYYDPACEIEYRKRAAELGWFAMLVPDALGGGTISGNGAADAALIAYHRGGLLQPGSFIGTNVVAYALAAGGTDEQKQDVLPNLLSGEQSASWALAGPGGGPAALDGGVSVEVQSGRYVLSGTKTLVQDVGPGSWLLVTAPTEEGPTQFLVPPGAENVTARSLESLDLTRRFFRVDFDRLPLDASAVVGSPGRAGDLIDRQLAIACVLTAAESVGAMDHDLGMAVQYAKDRIAFGRPIGSFQGLKHLLADTSLDLEMSKAITAAAAVDVGTWDGYGCEAASMAKAFVGDCGIDLAHSCFQVFGGIGYTWEHDQHLYLRRLTTDATLFGDPAWHRERICQLSGLKAG